MIGELISYLDLTRSFLRQQVADLTDEEMLRQPPGAPNHAAWTLGHIIHSWQEMAVELGAEPWLPNDWNSHFEYGSRPGGAVPGISGTIALIEALGDASNRLRDALLATDESSLAQAAEDENTRALMPTRGHVLVQVVVGHTAYHAGQLAAWRRAIGRPPAGVFI